MDIIKTIIPLKAIFPVVPVIILLLSINSCKKEEVELPVTVPELITISVSDIGQETATTGGKITYDGGDLITEKGICWNTNPNPVFTDRITLQGKGANSFVTILENLDPGVTYYLRAYAKNSIGIGYGNEMKFSTIPLEPLADIDGNTYTAKTYGNQVWMLQNLKTTRFNDGSMIDIHTDYSTWFYLTKPVYCWYNNDEAAYKGVYGALYNWYTVASGKLCPHGWHVPDEQEWEELEIFLGMNPLEAAAPYGWRGETDNIAGKMKEVGFIHWSPPNKGATNESRFAALPGGCRNLYGTFEYVKDYAYWWTASEADTTYSWARSLSYNLTSVYKSQYYKQSGFSVRCIKD